jgi:hypothetical protein
MPRRPGITSTLAVSLSAILSIALAGPSGAAEPVVRPALDGIFAAFETRPLVGIGDLHDLADEEAFYAAVVRDPRFAATVGNVVAEFGASQHQDILDRYLAGEDLPYSELSQVWRNTVAWSPTVTGIGYQTFFAQVRAVNLSLPAGQRIRVLLGEPPIDWSEIHTQDAWQRIYDQREIHGAEVIVREILDRGGLEARAWLHQTLTDNQLRALVTEFQGAGMSLELRARVRAELGLSEVDLPPHPRVGMPWSGPKGSS